MTTTVRLRAEGEIGSGKSTLLRLLVGLLKDSHLVEVEYVSDHLIEATLPDDLSVKMLERAEADRQQDNRSAAQLDQLNGLLQASQSEAASLRERETDLTARLTQAGRALGMASEIFARDEMHDLADFFSASQVRAYDGAGCARHEAETEIPW